jgi:REP element-mobilizing transposase RayT
MPDHVHMCIAIPPKHPVASVIGFRKGKSAMAIARLSGKERNFTGDRRAFLGSGLRGIHRGLRAGAGPSIHPRAGGGGW